MSEFRVASPYAPRSIAFRGVVEHRGHRLKRYTIALPGAAFAEAVFRSGRGLTLSALPEPAITDERPGVGFVVEHQGRRADYVVLAWWDRENELPIRLVVGDGDVWRPARDAESPSVWDLQIVAAERDAYVETVLTPGGGGVEAYLARAWSAARSG